MKQDAQAKFDALSASLTDLKSTVTAAENLLDGLVAQGANAPTDPEVLAKIDDLNSQVAALKAELAAKVVADTPA